MHQISTFLGVLTAANSIFAFLMLPVKQSTFTLTENRQEHLQK